MDDREQQAGPAAKANAGIDLNLDLDKAAEPVKDPDRLRELAARRQLDPRSKTEEPVREAEAPAAPREPEVNKLFRMVMKHEASDLHLKVGQPPMMRLRGDIRRVDMRPLTQEDMERLLLPHLSARQRT